MTLAKPIAIIVLLFALLWLVTPTHAQGLTLTTVSQCNYTPVILKLLTEKYHEIAIGGGINKRSEQVRLFVAPETWTILVTRPDGISCLVQVSGEDGEWVVAPPNIIGEKS